MINRKAKVVFLLLLILVFLSPSHIFSQTGDNSYYSLEEAGKIKAQMLDECLRQKANITITDLRIESFILQLRDYSLTLVNAAPSSPKEILERIRDIALKNGMPEAIEWSTVSLNEFLAQVNNHLSKYNLFLVLAREPYLGKVALILAQIDKNEYKEVTIPAPWNKRVSFREIFIKNNYVNLNPGMTSFNIKPLLPDLSVKEIIIVHNLDLEYNAAVHLFFNIFYWLQLRGIDINKNEFLTKEDLFLAAENKNLNDKSILYTKLTYKAWRNLYVEATAVYEDELSQARYFAQRYGEVVLAFKRWHEIVHLTQDEYGNLVNNEYEALMAELVLGSHFLNSLSMDFDNFFNMGEALPKEYQTAFTKLFVTVARAYQNSKENREMRVLESTVDELIHNLKGVDECSDKDISLIIEKIRENFVEEVHSW